jgi:hypothetical protein
LRGNDIRPRATEERGVADIEMRRAAIGRPSVTPARHSSLEADGGAEARNGGATSCSIQVVVTKREYYGRRMRDARNERLVAVLIQPWEIGPGAIGLDVVKATDGTEREPGREEWPAISDLDAIGVCLVYIQLEEWASGSDRSSNIPRGINV